jgi:hypothetical protein
MTVIRHMKTAAEDREVGVLLRNFDRAAARLAVLGVDVFKLREYVPADIHRGAVVAVETALDDPPPAPEPQICQTSFARGWIAARRAALDALRGQ